MNIMVCANKKYNNEYTVLIHRFICKPHLEDIYQQRIYIIFYSVSYSTFNLLHGYKL